jgi:hypothetical protein
VTSPNGCVSSVNARHRRFVFAVVALLLVTCWCVSAGAQTPEPDGEGDSRRVWYGYQVLGADLAWGLAAVATERGEFAVLYLASGPLVHLLNDRPLTAAGSLGLRVGLPLALAGITAVGEGDCKRTSSEGGEEETVETDLGCTLAPVIMGVFGAGLAMIVDATALSWKTERTPPKAPALVPQLVLRRGFASAGVAGNF